MNTHTDGKTMPELSFSELTAAGAGTASTLLGFTTQSWVAAYRRLGPVFRIKENGWVFACGEEMSREMWKHGDDWGYADTGLGHIFQSEIGPGYITASDGDLHRYQRRLLRPLFNGEPIHRHLGTIAQVLAEGFAALQGQQLDLHETLIFLYTKGLNRTMVQSGASDQLILRFARFEEEFIRGALLQGEQRQAWYQRPDYIALRTEVLGFFRGLIKQRLAGTSTGDNLDRLLAAMKQQNNGVLDEDEILRDAYLMQAGGAGNMAALCCTLLWLLLNNEQWHQQMRAEFQTLLPQQMMKSGISGLPFTRDFLLETERLFPVTPGVPKLALRDVELGGYAIAAGTEVLHFFVLAHFLDENHAQPFVFRPERWRESKLLRPHAFGGGEHVCIGQNLSYLFIVMTLQLLIGDYQVQAASGPYLKPVGGVAGAPLRTAFDLRLFKA